MAIIIFAVLISSLLGIASYYLESLFYAMLVGILPIAWVIFQILIVAAPVADPVAAGVSGRFTVYFDAFNNTPKHIQISIMLLPVCFFGSRLATWLYNIAFAPEPEIESKATKKQRILDSYGISSD